MKRQVTESDGQTRVIDEDRRQLHRRRTKEVRQTTTLDCLCSGSHKWSLYRQASQSLAHLWRWFQERRRAQFASKHLSVCETVSLGEKRFLAIAKVDGQHFLIGGASNSVCMLARLENRRGFAEVFQEQSDVLGRLVI